MEDVLEIYHRPYEMKHPVICMDEQPIQLVKEVRIPLPAQPGQPETFDFEYERNGTANIFLFTEPLTGWRKVVVTQQRTAIDWAKEIKTLLEEDYPQIETVTLICDQLNTHQPSSLYKAFKPELARSKRQKIRYSSYPKTWKLVKYCRT